MRTLKSLIAIFFIALPMLSSAADNDPQFEFAGTVDSIDMDNEMIIIGDMPFRFSPAITVLDTGRHPVDRKKLATGTKVGIKTYSRGEQGDATHYVYEIQMLRSNVDLEKLMDDN